MINLEWMAWTIPGAAFFTFIGVVLALMTIWEIVQPTTERKGFLPLSTTRGDRLFIGLLTSGFIHLAWVGFTDFHPGYATAACLVWLGVLMRWG